MPRAHGKRRRPVTARNDKPSAAPALPLPPIHVNGQEKIIIDADALSGVARGKLGKSSADTRRRINHFHTLIKEYSKLGAKRSQSQDPEAVAAIDEQITAVSREMAQMGGLDWYQKASLLGQSKQRGGDTSRWLVPKLRELNLDKRDDKLRMLDVGALSCLNYAKERTWIDVTPIDLNSQEPGIYQQDFLDIELGQRPDTDLNAEDGQHDDGDGSNSDDGDDNGKPAGNPKNEILCRLQTPFHIICLSLVVNFIGDPVKRGDMLRQAARLLAPEGLLFLVLPLSCVTNSRYLDDDRLLAIAAHLQFEQLFVHHTAKLAHYLYRLRPMSRACNADTGHAFAKKLLHSGPGRNNFSIVI